MPSTDRIFLDFSVKKLNLFLSRIEDCTSRLSHDQIWLRGNENQNAVGNLVLHLAGNVRQWIISGVGGAPDVRVRDTEFAAREGPAGELVSRLKATIAEAAAVIEKQTADGLTRHVRIQNYEMTVLEAIYHVVEHFAQHTAQIMFATKILTGQDLGYYAHLKAATHAEKTP